MSTNEIVKGSLLTGRSLAFGFLSKGVQLTLGFVVGIALNFIVIPGTSFLLSGGTIHVGPIQFYLFYFLGATQLLWLLPLILFLRKRCSNVALGILLAAVATALFCNFFGRLEVWPH